MKNQYLYLIVVLVILVIAALGLYFFTSVGMMICGPCGCFNDQCGGGGGGNSFDFGISASPGSATITQGQSTSSTITATLLKGKTQAVQLSLSGCPASTTCSLNKTVVNPTGSTSLIIITTSSTPTGSSIITVNGAGGGKTKSAAFSLVVNPVPCTCSAWTNGACGGDGCSSTQRQQTRTCTPSGCNVQSQCVADSSCTQSFDFSLSASPSSGTVSRGRGISTGIKATLLSGSTQDVQLSLASCPSTFTCQIYPLTGKPTFASYLLLNTTLSTPAGTYAFTVNGVSGSITRTATYTLTVQ